MGCEGLAFLEAALGFPNMSYHKNLLGNLITILILGLCTPKIVNQNLQERSLEVLSLTSTPCNSFRVEHVVVNHYTLESTKEILIIADAQTSPQRIFCDSSWWGLKKGCSCSEAQQVNHVQLRVRLLCRRAGLGSLPGHSLSTLSE